MYKSITIELFSMYLTRLGAFPKASINGKKGSHPLHSQNLSHKCPQALNLFLSFVPLKE